MLVPERSRSTARLWFRPHLPPPQSSHSRQRCLVGAVRAPMGAEWPQGEELGVRLERAVERREAGERRAEPPSPQQRS